MRTTIKLEGDAATREVKLNGKPLSPEASQKLINHSPDGFAWGYNGSGPSQLALAVLLEITSKELALKNYREFREEIISRLPMDYNFGMQISLPTKWFESKAQKLTGSKGQIMISDDPVMLKNGNHEN